MDLDNKLILEGYPVFKRMAGKNNDLKLAIDALKECLKHFKAEPTDPGHPELLKQVEYTFNKLGIDPTESVPPPPQPKV